MVLQTHDDWRRMLDACAAGIGTAWDAGDALAVLNGEDRNWQFSASVGRIAAALGIDKRRPLNWQPRRDGSDGDMQVPGSAGDLRAATLTADDSCAAEAWYEGSGLTVVRVTGHPTRESAVEHLERLLGREG